MSLFRLFPQALCGLTLILSSALLAHSAPPATTPKTPATAPAAPTTTPVDPESDLIGQAMAKMNANDADGALAKLTEAIKLRPTVSGAYILRASIYCQRKQWSLAEQDFKTAASISPNNPIIPANLAEIQFMQKKFDVARPMFVALTKDPDMGDLAKYKVFLCDLFGGHEAQAKKELDVFNSVGSEPSYYFSNAAWALFHKNTEEARGWLVSASNIFVPRKNTFYAAPLRDLGYLPLPPSKPAN